MNWQYIKSLSTFNTTKTENDTINGWYEEAWNHTLAYIFLEGVDKTKYSTVVKTLYTQHSLGNNQYPKTLEKAIEALSNHNLTRNIMMPSRREGIMIEIRTKIKMRKT